MQYPSYKLSFKNQFRTMASLTVYRTGRQQCPSGYSRGEEIRDFYLIHYVMHGCGVFTLNVVGKTLKDAALQWGRCSGRDHDKAAEFGMSTETLSDDALRFLRYRYKNKK